MLSLLPRQASIQAGLALKVQSLLAYLALVLYNQDSCLLTNYRHSLFQETR